MAALPDDLRERVRQRLDRARPRFSKPPGPPATAGDIAASEQRLGFVLPPPVRALFEIANGGAGFIGLVNGMVDEFDDDIVDKYESFLLPEDDPDAPVPWEWRTGVLPILD